MMTRILAFGALVLTLACSSEKPVTAGDGGGGGNPTGSTNGAGGSGGSGGSTTTAGGMGGTGGVGGMGGSAGGAGGGGGQSASSLDDLLEALRLDAEQTMLDQSREGGWPAAVEDGYLVVTTDLSLTEVAGDHDVWAGTALTIDQGFAWRVLPLVAGNRYKFTDGVTYVPDPWARAYAYDSFGVMTMLAPTDAHLERYFEVGATNVEPRKIRVWVPAVQVPAAQATHVLYMHDGQNLFDPGAFFGGWQLQGVVPPAMMVVGIDNSPARMNEYTHIVDDIGNGAIGGAGDDYTTFVNDTVRSLIADHYGEPSTVGVMGSSLGGLISLHMADRFPNSYAFAGSMSGTAGWGSIGLNNATIIERLGAAGHEPIALYVDSGGSGTCVDSDNDGIDDDGTDFDNYCVNLQLAAVLRTAGYSDDIDFWHWHEPDAQHNELAWASRVWRPLGLFAAL